MLIRPLYRRAIYRGVPIRTNGEDALYYYVYTNKHVPEYFFIDMEHLDVGESSGKIPKTDPDLFFEE